MNRSDIPSNVMTALESLESATSPTDLGGPYQVLLDWRRQHRMAIVQAYVLNLAPTLAIIAAIAIFLMIAPLLTFEITEFWRGASLGAAVTTIIVGIRNWLSPPRPLPTPSVGARIEAAIDRWRHVAPAMRELPR